MADHPSGWRPAGPGRWLRTIFRTPAGKKVLAASGAVEGSYNEEVARFDRMLDENIASIRARQDAGEISVRQAADLRVEALSQHLAALQDLRARHFGHHPDD